MSYDLNKILVSANPGVQTNQEVYRGIADLLDAELELRVPIVCSKECITEESLGYPPRLYIHDATTYDKDPILEQVHSFTEDELMFYGMSYEILYPRDLPETRIKPMMIFNGPDNSPEDSERIHLGTEFDYYFGDNPQKPFNPENVVDVLRVWESKL